MAKRIALMFHGTRETRDTLDFADHRLGPTAKAFQSEGFEVEPCVYNDDSVAEIKEQLLHVDAVQIWVNPIMDDGHDRTHLDALLNDIAGHGILVSSHPDTIQKIGTKSVLYETRSMGWAGDVYLYRSAQEMRLMLPRLLQNGPRVIKQHRGHSGQGVWKLTADGSESVLVKPAARGAIEEGMTLAAWVESCEPFFQSGPMLDQEYNPEIERGTIRCYLVRDKVEGFGHQEANALVPGVDPGPRLYFPADRPDFQPLKRKVEDEWLPRLMETVSMHDSELPHLWDMDFMLRGDGWMLCEINVSSVYPYPESAMAPLARSFKSALAQSRPQ